MSCSLALSGSLSDWDASTAQGARTRALFEGAAARALAQPDSEDAAPSAAVVGVEAASVLVRFELRLPGLTSAADAQAAVLARAVQLGSAVRDATGLEVLAGLVVAAVAVVTPAGLAAPAQPSDGAAADARGESDDPDGGGSAAAQAVVEEEAAAPLQPEGADAAALIVALAVGLPLAVVAAGLLACWLRRRRGARGKDNGLEEGGREAQRASAQAAAEGGGGARGKDEQGSGWLGGTRSAEDNPVLTAGARGERRSLAAELREVRLSEAQAGGPPGASAGGSDPSPADAAQPPPAPRARAAHRPAVSAADVPRAPGCAMGPEAAPELVHARAAASPVKPERGAPARLAAGAWPAGGAAGSLAVAVDEGWREEAPTSSPSEDVPEAPRPPVSEWVLYALPDEAHAWAEHGGALQPGDAPAAAEDEEWRRWTSGLAARQGRAQPGGAREDAEDAEWARWALLRAQRLSASPLAGADGAPPPSPVEWESYASPPRNPLSPEEQREWSEWEAARARLGEQESQVGSSALRQGVGGAPEPEWPHGARNVYRIRGPKAPLWARDAALGPRFPLPSWARRGGWRAQVGSGDHGLRGVPPGPQDDRLAA